MHSGKSLRERALQALGFELLAIALSTPLLAWAMDAHWQTMGVITVATCVIALIWNVLYNRTFDWLLQRMGRVKTASVRLVHALLFEGGLVVFCVPFAAWWLSISLWQALLMEIGLLLFFLPYTYLYHWAYDSLRGPVQRWYGRRKALHTIDNAC